MGIPLGEFSDFISEPGWRGFSIRGNGYLNDKLLLGGSYHWSGFREYNPRQTYEFDGGAVTGEIWKKAYFNNFNFNVTYMFMPEAAVQPYAGAGMGAYHIEQSTQLGKYASIPKNWKFGMAPTAGVYIPIGMADWGFSIQATYNHIFYNIGNINNLGYFSISAGIGIYAW
jgi:hypothetical protein